MPEKIISQFEIYELIKNSYAIFDSLIKALKNKI